MTMRSDEYIIKCIAHLRILNIKNLIYFEENGLGSDTEPYRKKVEASNITADCTKLVKYGYLDRETCPQSYLFKKGQIELEKNETDVYHYFLTPKGVKYYTNESIVLQKISYIRSVNCPIYTAINAAFLQFIDRLNFTFDCVRHNRGPFVIHENHAQISLQYIKLIPKFQILYMNTKIGIRFLTRTEITPGYIRFLIEKMLSRTKEFDWMIFLIKDPHYKINLSFLKEYNKIKIYQRLRYTNATSPKNLSNNPEIAAKHLLVETPPYEGGCPFSLLSVQECFDNLSKGIIDEFKV